MLSTTEKLAFLETISFFSTFSPEQRAEISAATCEVHYEANTTLFKTGDAGDALYIIIRGQVRIHQGEETLVYRSDGDCIGEIAILDDAPRTASATTEVATQLLKLNQEDFWRIVKHIEFAKGIFRVLTHKLREEIKSKVQLECEMAQAREIQRLMLPKSLPVFTGLSIASFCEPAQMVGGDYYDLFPLTAERLAVAFGDVTGHGLHTGMLVAMAKSCLLNQVKRDPSVSAVMEAMNEMVFETFHRRLLITFCYAIIDLNKNQLEYASAGHLPPYHYNSQTGTLRLLPTSESYPLGVRLDTAFPSQQTAFHHGEMLLLYSDGLVEATHPQVKDSAGGAEILGYDGFETIVSENITPSALETKDRIIHAIRQYSQGGIPEDDMTLLVLRMDA
ncbi:SpoIIE family protein phosphatase [Candidatus Poribacteria bacterium]|nr:SpoIIE family protein phosphatase [Candidatus Poribacteria bacterium]